MKKPLSKRGRKKGVKSTSALLNNETYWYFIFKTPNRIEEFIEKGNARQHQEIKACLENWRQTDGRFFERINGEEILKQLKRDKKL